MGPQPQTANQLNSVAGALPTAAVPGVTSAPKPSAGGYAAQGGYAAASQQVAKAPTPGPAIDKQTAASAKKLAKMPVYTPTTPAKGAGKSGSSESAPGVTPTGASDKSGSTPTSQTKAPVRLAAMPVAGNKEPERRERYADVPNADDMDVWAADASARDGKASASTAPAAAKSQSKVQPKVEKTQPPAQNEGPQWRDKYGDVADADELDCWAADSSATVEKVRAAVPAPGVTKESEVHDKFEQVIAEVTAADDMDTWAANIKETPQRNELVGLALRLERLPPDAPSSTVLSVLEAIERIPATFEDLQVTRLGVLTQPFKDSPDMQVRTVVKRLRHAWKQTPKDTVT